MPPKIKGKKIQTLEVVYQITEVINQSSYILKSHANK